jgi:hypothetical protein
MSLIVTALTPTSAAARGIHNGGHGIIVVCRKAH